MDRNVAVGHSLARSCCASRSLSPCKVLAESEIRHGFTGAAWYTDRTVGVCHPAVPMYVRRAPVYSFRVIGCVNVLPCLSAMMTSCFEYMAAYGS